MSGYLINCHLPTCNSDSTSVNHFFHFFLNQDPFLEWIVTGDEKWILYVNARRKRQWLNKNQPPIPTPKPEFHQRKVMLSVWWNVDGIIHFELLPKNSTITAAFYAQQLVRVHEALVHKHPALVTRKGIVFLHDNARPHVAKLSRDKIKELGCMGSSPSPTLFP